ncbi:MAG: SDR family oxidoreductase [Myxococcales bacterium]|nr:SDR family oxidoreductase [Myxococcales bacterium]
MKRFEGKKVVITGAAQGIGQATAQRIAEEGGDVALLDVNEAGLAATQKLVEAHGVGCSLHPCNVRDTAGVHAAVEAAAEALGGVDTLLHIAGVLRTYNTHEMTYEQWDEVIDINLNGTYRVNHAALPHLLKNRFSVIVNMASTAAIGSHPWMSAYAASKGGVISFTRSLYIEYVKQGLRANCVVAGGIATTLHQQFKPPTGGDMDLVRGAMPYGSFAKPKHAASVFAFLASDDARFINGTEVRADGGALS